MSSIRKRLLAAAGVAVVTSATVLVAAAPSSADQAAITLNTAAIRELIDVDPLPDVGDIVDPGSLPSCQPTADYSYCITVGGVVLGPLHVPNVDYNTVHITDVVAYVDVYKAQVGDFGAEVLACVTLAQPTTADACSVIGFEHTDRIPLVAQPVDAYTPYVASEPLTTVEVCEATVNARVAGRAFDGKILTVC